MLTGSVSVESNKWYLFDNLENKHLTNIFTIRTITSSWWFYLRYPSLNADLNNINKLYGKIVGTRHTH